MFLRVATLLLGVCLLGTTTFASSDRFDAFVGAWEWKGKITIAARPNLSGCKFDFKQITPGQAEVELRCATPAGMHSMRCQLTEQLESRITGTCSARLPKEHNNLKFTGLFVGQQIRGEIPFGRSVVKVWLDSLPDRKLSFKALVLGWLDLNAVMSSTTRTAQNR